MDSTPPYAGMTSPLRGYWDRCTFPET